MNKEIRNNLIDLLVELTYLKYKGDKESLRELINLLDNDEIIKRVFYYIEENKND